LSPNPVNESSLDFRADMQRSQHNDRGNRGAGKLGRHIAGNAGKSQHVDVECLPGCAHRFEIFTAVVPQTELQAFSSYRLPDDVGVSVELVADGSADKVGTVRVKAVLDHQVDLAKVNMTEVDGDLLGVAGLRSQFAHVVSHRTYHPITIHLDGQLGDDRDPVNPSNMAGMPHCQLYLRATLQKQRHLLYQCHEGRVHESRLYDELNHAAGELAQRIVQDLPEYDKASWGD